MLSKEELDKQFGKYAESILEAILLCVEGEREECARIADKYDLYSIKATILIDSAVAKTIAGEIRARSKESKRQH